MTEDMKLVDIAEEQWRRFTGLTVTEDQHDFVASPVLILARGYVYRAHHARVRGIEVDGVPVGLVSGYERVGDDGRRWWYLDQLLIDAPHQRRGYGKATLATVIDEARADGVAGIQLCYVASNVAVHRLCMDLGFTSRPEDDDGDELVMELKFDLA